MHNKIEGVVVAMVTPLERENERINVKETKRLITFLLGEGVNALFILGTTGEGLSLSVENRKRFAEIVIDYVDDKVPIIVHASHMEQERLRDLIQHAQNIGASGIALLPPLFYPLQEQEIKSYFKAVLESFTQCSFFLYNIPQFTGNKITPSIVQDLSETHRNLVGIKSSNTDLVDFQKFLTLKHKLTILVGHDSLTYPALLLGAQGVVSGPSSVFPEIYVLLYKALRDKKYELSLECQLIINEIADLFQGRVNLALFKNALEVRGFDMGGVRSPLCDLDATEKMHFLNLVREFLEDKYLKMVKNLFPVCERF